MQTSAKMFNFSTLAGFIVFACPPRLKGVGGEREESLKDGGYPLDS